MILVEISMTFGKEKKTSYVYGSRLIGDGDGGAGLENEIWKTKIDCYFELIKACFV